MWNALPENAKILQKKHLMNLGAQLGYGKFIGLPIIYQNANPVSSSFYKTFSSAFFVQFTYHYIVCLPF